MAKTTGDQYDSLQSENENIAAQYKYARTQSELSQLEREYESNQGKMEQYRKDLNTYNALLAVGLVWEGYLFFFGDESNSYAFNPRLNLKDRNLISSLSITYNW